MKLNEKVRRAARTEGIPLYAVARAMGISEPTIHRWLRTPLPPDTAASGAGKADARSHQAACKGGVIMPRMRTIEQTAAYLRDNDPDCALTKTALRRMVKTGQIPSVKIGEKSLLNLDVVENYLTGEIPTAPMTEHGIIRRVV